MTLQDERVDQQGALTSNMEAARGDEVPPTQEEERPADQDVADQSGVTMPEAEPEDSTEQEQEMPETGDLTSDQSDDERSGNEAAEQPERELRAVSAMQLETADESRFPQQD